MRKIESSAVRFLAGDAILVICLLIILFVLQAAGIDLKVKDSGDRILLWILFFVLIGPFILGAIKIGDWIFKPKH